jgi:hypothetical protein
MVNMILDRMYLEILVVADKELLMARWKLLLLCLFARTE